MKCKTAEIRTLTINFQVFFTHEVLADITFLTKMKSSLIKLKTLPNELFGLNLPNT